VSDSARSDKASRKHRLKRIREFFSTVPYRRHDDVVSAVFLIALWIIPSSYWEGVVNAFYLLKAWQSKKGKINLKTANIGNLPILKPRHEEHVVYKNLQPQMLEGLWKDEVEKVRAAYRCLELIEKQMEVIHTTYEELISKKLSAKSDATTNASSAFSDWVVRRSDHEQCSEGRMEREIRYLIPKQYLAGP
jgi:hypothetical protein